MKNVIILFCLLFISFGGWTQEFKANTDEALVPDYELPELLISQKGRKIKLVKKWEKVRRPEIYKLFENEMFGKIPGELKIDEVKVWDDNNNALNGQARRKQIGFYFRRNGKELYFELLMYIPKNVSDFPLFLGYNFYGNHTVSYDPDIRLTSSWLRDNPSFGIIHHQATEQSRGVRVERWPIEKIIQSGCGIATVYYGDVDPDKDSFNDGVHPLLYNENETEPAHNEWGAIAAWAWGLSRVMDYFETDTDVDASKVVVFGHSRLGKTALWAGASDSRFAAVISNDSGCGGAAISRRCFGETIARINTVFPHWFCGNFKKYNNRESQLPFDQHMLLALIAPRPLYVASASDDLWADPKGEFLSAIYASPVYQLYGLIGIPIDEMPENDSPVRGIVNYHVRSGKHNIVWFDWEQYIRFAKTMLK